MAFKLFEFLEGIVIGAILITLTQLEKTGKETVHVFCAISTFVFEDCYLRHFQQMHFK